MQFFLNGYKSGDPLDCRDEDPLEITPSLRNLPDAVDVLIVGCGPAGLTLATQLAHFANIRTCIIEQKSGPLQRGQADGISGRSLEIFQSFSFSERILKEAYYLNAISFWKYDSDHPENITRVSKQADGRSAYSEFPHVILNQARVHNFLLDRMSKLPAQIQPDYCRKLDALSIANDAVDYPILATIERLDEDNKGKKETVKARYLVGCDGARSSVRGSLSLSMIGESANKAWGVMDLLLITDFPDIRVKCVLQSLNEGNVMIIPREGGHLVRMYIELDQLKSGERASHLGVTSDQLIAAAQRVFHPYTLDVKEVVWWSVYEVGQRISEHFDNALQQQDVSGYPNVFIAGDACHTHSPKAGQGMNVSIHDSFNLGWKLVSVLQGQSLPNILQTYAVERRAIAEELIAFDRILSKAFSASDSTTKSGSQEKAQSQLQKLVLKAEGYMTGTLGQYKPSIITAEARYQYLAGGFEIGKRFYSAPVVRLVDGKRMHLGHRISADNRWRIFIFSNAENPRNNSSTVRKLVRTLEYSPDSFVLKFTPPGSDIDSVFDIIFIFQQSYFELGIEDLPAYLTPQKGRYGLRDYEKLFCPAVDSDIFDMRAINRKKGCIVVVRPDQHIAHILPLDRLAELDKFFTEFMCAN